MRSEVLTFFGCGRTGPLLDLAQARTMLRRASRAARLTELRAGGAYHKFRQGGKGLTAFVLLSQSHVALHSWPEVGVATVEFLSYEDHPFGPAIEVLEEALRPGYVARRSVGGLSFVEEYGSDLALWMGAERILASERSAFQSIHMFRSGTLGTVLTLDGKVQTTERDEFCYHEMLVHPALQAHRGARRVAVLGGGDLGAAREVLRHPGTEVEVIEIDRRVVDLSRKFLPWAEKVASSPRVRLRYEDGAAALRGAPGRYDAILVDATDPFPDGPGDRLFTPRFYADAARALRPGGVFVSQAGSSLYYGERTREIEEDVRGSFDQTFPFMVPVPTYPFGNWTFLLARQGKDEWKFRKMDLPCRVYAPDVVEAGRVLARAFERSGLCLTSGSSAPRGHF